MKKGETVMVYEDPLTMKKEEGFARLLELRRGNPLDGLEYWKVKFLSDKFVATRLVGEYTKGRP